MRRSGLLRAKRTNGEPHYALNAITMPFSYGVASDREGGERASDCKGHKSGTQVGIGGNGRTGNP